MIFDTGMWISKDHMLRLKPIGATGMRLGVAPQAIVAVLVSMIVHMVGQRLEKLCVVGEKYGYCARPRAQPELKC